MDLAPLLPIRLLTPAGLWEPVEEILGGTQKNNVVFLRPRNWHFSANRQIDAKHFRFSLASREILDYPRRISSFEIPFDILGRNI
jgi:hypothetical protein